MANDDASAEECEEYTESATMVLAVALLRNEVEK
jgi:hypothetical protein